MNNIQEKIKIKLKDNTPSDEIQSVPLKGKRGRKIKYYTEEELKERAKIAYKKYYSIHRPELLEYKKVKNKQYIEKHSNRFYCETCKKYFPTLTKVQVHFITRKHQTRVENLDNKFVIIDNYCKKYVM